MNFSLFCQKILQELSCIFLGNGYNNKCNYHSTIMSANKRKIKNLYRHLKGDLKMLKPLADHIVVELTVKEEKTSSGIYLPDTASKEKPQTGKVVAVGAGKVLDNGTRVAPEVKAGDEVVFAKYSGTEFKYDGKDYLILSERDVLAVL